MHTESSNGTRRFGIFEADLNAAELRKHGIRIKLQDQPFRILSLLLERPGTLITREEIREQLWPNHTFVDFDRSLNKAMAKLRSALSDSAECPRYIETVPRHGYRFLLPVDSNAHPKNGNGHFMSPVPPIDNFPGESVIDVAPRELLKPARTFYSLAGGWGSALVLGVFVTVVALAVLLAFQLKQRTSSAALAGNVSPRRSLAVLGFQNLSSDARDAWLSTAISEWLSTDLSAGDQLRTVPAESVARMKMELGTPDIDALVPERVTRIRKNLGTDLILVGSYAVIPDDSSGQVRLDARLIDAHSGETVGAISEVGSKSSLLDLVSRAGAALRAKLGLRNVTTEEAAEVATSLPSNEQAARYYAEGLSRLRVFDDLTARDLLQKAIDAEPNSALAHAALAMTWSELGYDRNASIESKTAFDLSSNLSRAERLLIEGRYREMSNELDQAIEIYQALFRFFPDDPEYGLALANAQLNGNHWRDALGTISALRALPPPLGDDPRIDLAEGDAARSLGDMKKAEECKLRAAERARAIDASLLVARALLDLAWLYENSGRTKDVDAVVQEARTLYSAARDRRGVARSNTLEAIALTSRGDYVGAHKKYEESLATENELGNKLGTANLHDDLGDLYFFLGSLSSAKNSYQQALSAYQEINDEDGASLAKIGLGDVSLAEGNPSEAQRFFEDSVATCRRIADPSREASALAGLGAVQRVQGYLDTSWKTEVQAQQIFAQLGDRSSEAETDLELVKLLLDQQNYAQAESWAQQAQSLAQNTGARRQAAAAEILLSRSLLEQRKFVPANEALQRAAQFAEQSRDRPLHLFAEFTAGLLATSSHQEQSAARLTAVARDAESSGFLGLSLEVRLALAEVQLDSGQAALGRSQLKAIEQEATRHGYLLVSKKAAADLQKPALHASR